MIRSSHAVRRSSTILHSSAIFTMALILALVLLSACSPSSPSLSTGIPESTSLAQTTQEQSQTAESTLDSATNHDTPASSDTQAASLTREITDMAGRVMTVPTTIDKAFSSSPNAAIYLYMIAPDKLLGWNYALNDTEKSYILTQYHDLSNFGMGDATNYEAVIAANPNIAVSMGGINENTISQADNLSASLGIPVVLISDRLADAPAVFRFLSDLLGVAEHGEKLAQYTETAYRDIADTAIPDSERVRVYFGNGEDYLETAPAGSSSEQLISTANGINAAEVDLADSGSRVRISLEQLLVWDPDVIIVNGEPRVSLSSTSAAEAILGNSDFASLQAVQNGRVYGIPNAPFSWADRPQGPNRIIGMRWLSILLYPDYIQYDLDTEVKTFFSLFYHVELTEAQLHELYKG